MLPSELWTRLLAQVFDLPFDGAPVGDPAVAISDISMGLPQTYLHLRDIRPGVSYGANWNFLCTAPLYQHTQRVLPELLRLRRVSKVFDDGVRSMLRAVYILMVRLNVISGVRTLRWRKVFAPERGWTPTVPMPPRWYWLRLRLAWLDPYRRQRDLAKKDRQRRRKGLLVWDQESRPRLRLKAQVRGIRRELRLLEIQ